MSIAGSIPSDNSATAVSHTPGPWVAERVPAEAHTDPDINLEDTAEFWIVDQGRAGEVLAIVERTSRGEAEANAHLMAASSELLSSLKALIADIDSGLLVRDITRDGEPGWSMHMLAFVQRLQAAQAAIAKAEGR